MPKVSRFLPRSDGCSRQQSARRFSGASCQGRCFASPPMLSRYKRRLVALAGGAALFVMATPVLAAETSNSEFVIIREDDVFPGDLYAGAIRVTVDGTLDGDLVAFAAEEIVINGTVTGSVIAVTPHLTVNGEVGESLRVTGNRLEIAGQVEGD